MKTDLFMEPDNVDLIVEIGEMATSLFRKSHTLDEFLEEVVKNIAFRMNAAVCSIYLFNEGRRELVLAANQGLAQEQIGRVRINMEEGLVGLALRELRPINVGRAPQHPEFKFIPELREEPYNSLLAVPITQKLSRIGVLVVQDPVKNYFTRQNEMQLRAIVSQIAIMIENATLIKSLREAESRTPNGQSPQPVPTLINGTTASKGLAIGQAFVLSGMEYDVLVSMDVEGPRKTLKDFQAALEKTEGQLIELLAFVEEDLSDVASLIFNAHLLILRDPEFTGQMASKIQNGTDPERAVTAVVNDYIHLFEKSTNPRLQEKVQDLKDLGHRLLHNLSGRRDDNADYDGKIIIAQDLLPSDIVKFVAQNAAGLIVTKGTIAGHIAILARSLQVPLVFVDNRRLLSLPEDTPLILDAMAGNVYIEPSDNMIDSFSEQLEAIEQSKNDENIVQEQSHTKCGTRINLMANINLLSDVAVATRLKAEGVGLYRSEIPFIVRSSFPSEAEQYRVYRKIVDGMEGKPVIFRTLDIGGDKVLPYHSESEANPFMGLRAIRFSLRNRSIFSSQLRAMLRAKAGCIMFPFISSVDDFLEAKDVVRECMSELRAEGNDFVLMPRIGAMVELPAAVEIVDELAEAADFLSIGTNDLIQYMLAADRTNENVADFYVPYHPAVLRALKKIVVAANQHGTDVSLCGDLARDPAMIEFIIGIGLRKISVEPRSIPVVQKRLANLEVAQATQMADDLLSMGRLSDIRAFLDAR